MRQTSRASMILPLRISRSPHASHDKPLNATIFTQAPQCKVRGGRVEIPRGPCILSGTGLLSGFCMHGTNHESSDADGKNLEHPSRSSHRHFRIRAACRCRMGGTAAPRQPWHRACGTRYRLARDCHASGTVSRPRWPAGDSRLLYPVRCACNRTRILARDER